MLRLQVLGPLRSDSLTHGRTRPPFSCAQNRGPDPISPPQETVCKINFIKMNSGNYKTCKVPQKFQYSSSEKSQPSLRGLVRMQATRRGTSHCVSKTGSVLHVTPGDNNCRAAHHRQGTITHKLCVSKTGAKSEQSEHMELSDTHVQAETLPR